MHSVGTTEHARKYDYVTKKLERATWKTFFVPKFKFPPIKKNSQKNWVHDFPYGTITKFSRISLNGKQYVFFYGFDWRKSFAIGCKGHIGENEFLH